MKPDKNKKLAAMVLDKMDSEKESEEVESKDEEEGESMSDDEAAAQEVMDAMQSGDVGSFSTALKSFIKLCHYGD